MVFLVEMMEEAIRQKDKIIGGLCQLKWNLFIKLNEKITIQYILKLVAIDYEVMHHYD